MLSVLDILFSELRFEIFAIGNYLNFAICFFGVFNLKGFKI